MSDFSQKKFVQWGRRLAWITLLLGYILVAWRPVWCEIETFVTPRLPNLMVGVYLLGLGIPLIFWFCSSAPDTSVPRLWAGIFLAVVGTIMQQNWENMQKFGQEHLLALIVISVFLILAAYEVMLAKIRGTTGFENKGNISIRNLWSEPAHRRSGTLWFMGLTRSFLVGLLLTDLLGDIYVSQPLFVPSSLIVSRMPGAIGHTYPGLVLLFTALALFVGIFAQLLWEEKPITEAIL